MTEKLYDGIFPTSDDSEKSALKRVADRQDKKELKALCTQARKQVRAKFHALTRTYKSALKAEKAELIEQANVEAIEAFFKVHQELADAGALALHIADTDVRTKGATQ